MGRQVLHDLIEHDKEKDQSCVVLGAAFDCLFVHSIYIPSIQSSCSSHSLIGDSTRECLDSLQLMSLLLNL